MNHDDRRGLGRPAHAAKALISGVALSALLGLSMNAQAQSCTIGNWAGGAENDDALFAGNPGEGNPRYGGPCSLAVSLDSGFAYVVDNSPVAEQDYIARFYFNPNGNGSNDAPMVIFAANESTDGTGSDALQLWFNVADAESPLSAQANHVTLVVATETGFEQIQAGATSISPTGWNSFEIVWSADPSADIILRVNDGPDLSVGGDTSNQRIRSALLGFVDEGASVSSTAPLFFDDFDSRRQSRPGRLCRGLTDDARDFLSLEDTQAIFAEVSGGGAFFAPGQPDYDEDGVVGLGDAQAVFQQVSAGANACADNS